MNKTEEVRDVYRYAMIDATNSKVAVEDLIKGQKILEKGVGRAPIDDITMMVHGWQRRIRDGVCLSQYGESPIRFFEVLKKEGPIVGAVKHAVQEHGLYPAYVIQEDKDHLPKENTGTKWYVVDEVRYDLTGMDKAKFSAWKTEYIATCKYIYREHHVFIKTFAYLGKYGVVHVMSFNTDRDPLYTGLEIGVPQWAGAVDILMDKMSKQGFVPANLQKKRVRYTNL